jgi:hypothetical protein
MNLKEMHPGLESNWEPQGAPGSGFQVSPSTTVNEKFLP